MPSTERYNVLILMDDQHRADALGCAGHPLVHTPHLDRLAREGARFADACCNSPSCAPSRASLLTGRYPRQASQRSNDESLPNASWTFGRALGAAGYRTAALGKMHLLPYREDPAGHDVYQGFTDRITTEYVYPGIPAWIVSLTAEERAVWEPQAKRTTYPAGESVAGYVGEPSVLPEARQPEWWVTEHVLDWLRAHVREHKEERFCLLASVDAPHPPHLTPSSVAGLYRPEDVTLPLYRDPSAIADVATATRVRRSGWHEMTEWQVRLTRARYLASVTYVDRCFGRILEEVDRLGLRDTTLVVFLSDHGEMLGEHSAFGKYCFYEAAVRIPLIVRLPGAIPGQVSNAPVQMVDLFPTFLAAAGLAPPANVPGRNLLPLLRGEPAGPEPWPSGVLLERYSRGRPEWISDAWREAQWKLIRHGTGAVELYDLYGDAYELRNLSGTQDCAEVQTRLEAQLDAQIAAAAVQRVDNRASAHRVTNS